MYNTEDLTGKPVLVHPLLRDDPAGRTGQVGKITLADLEHDFIYVGFEQGAPGLYGADALLLLKEPDEILSYMKQNAIALSADDFHNLRQITQLQSRDADDSTQIALLIARDHENIRQASLVSVEDHLGLRRTQHTGR